MSGAETKEDMSVSGTMRAVVNHGPNDYRLEKVAIPDPGTGEGLIRVEAVGICASDLKCYQGAAKFWGDESRPAWAETDVIPGHEIVGRITTLDDVAAARWKVAVGDRVVVEQILPCGTCRYCMRGAYHLCQVHNIYGFQRATPGGMAEYMVLHAGARVHKIDADLPPAHAAFAEPLSCALHAVERASLQLEDVVVVAGCGPIGLGMIAGSAAKSPAAVIAIDQDEHRLDLARKTGATHTVNFAQQNPRDLVDQLTDGYGCDVYFEATGHPSAVGQGLGLLRKQGRYIEYSVFKADATVDWSIIGDDKELDVLGAHLGPYCWPAAIRLIEQGRLPLDEICSHQLPLEKFQDGLDLVAAGDKSIKVTLMP